MPRRWAWRGLEQVRLRHAEYALRSRAPNRLLQPVYRHQHPRADGHARHNRSQALGIKHHRLSLSAAATSTRRRWGWASPIATIASTLALTGAALAAASAAATTAAAAPRL